MQAHSAATKMIVLLTDGSITDSDMLNAQDMFEGSEAVLVALIIAEEDNVSFRQLTGIARSTGGNAVLVDDILELPELMRQEAELQRSAVVIGPSQVREVRKLPGMPAGRSWPDIHAFSLTRPANGAELYLVSERGDPLIASRISGAGRVVSVTPGFSMWSHPWLAWEQWPEFAAGLTNHTISQLREGERLFVETAIDDSRTLVLDSADRRATGPLMLHLQGPATSEEIVLDLYAPGRLTADLSSAYTGKYSLYTPGLAEPLRHDIYLDADPSGRGERPPVASTWRDAGLIRQIDDRASINLASHRNPARALAFAALFLFLLIMTLERELPGNLRHLRRRAGE